MTSTNTFEPTAEQREGLALYLTGVDLAVNAGAGTGKTSFLKLCAEATPSKKIQFVAFNKDIVVDASKKMPPNVNCSTMHSLAYRATKRDLISRLNGPRQKGIEIADRLNINESLRVTNWDDATREISRSFLGSLVVKTIEKFCQSADAEPGTQHVPSIPGLDAPQEKGVRGSGRKKGPAWQQVATAIQPYVKRAWADLNSPHGVLRYEPQHYLKQWQLTKPRIHADVILFDESQDADPVMIDVVENQKHAQIVWVGDEQQQIYEWRGAVNALKNVKVEARSKLSQSFRFGPAIAAQANIVLSLLHADMKITGTEKIPSQIGDVAHAEADAILCRTNAGTIRSLIHALDAGRRPAIAGGGGEVKSFAIAAAQLQRGQRVDHLELACFEDWKEVQTYVAEDAAGGDLKLLVDLIDEFGTEEIIRLADSAVDSRKKGVVAGRDYDLVITTGHKSKGLEWDRVLLGGDFPSAEKIDAEGLRLLYVAVTRAKLVLDISAVALFADTAPIDSDDRQDVTDAERDAGTLFFTPFAGGEEVLDVEFDAPVNGNAVLDAARALLAASDRDFEDRLADLAKAVEAAA